SGNRLNVIIGHYKFNTFIAMFLIIRKIYLSLYRTHVSKDVIYRMIRQGSIPSYNFGQRLTRLSRQYMDEHFKAKNRSKKRKKETLSFEPKDCYTIGEIAKKFHINDSSVFKHIRRHSIPTCQIGNYVYVPKSEIDKLYKSL
ncbi:helix-turn-helix domain-containing protein, partial [Phocaeicola plebeius]|uniref:helix-turn-helix domain-containing protein n=1 Tax=Phocaeicola plebeius TaxID=310297 RepID=UPI001EF53552